MVFNLMCTVVGLCSLSTDTSLKARRLEMSKEETDGTVISPDLKKPKKQREAAAHSMCPSHDVGCSTYTTLSLSTMPTVMS